MYGEQRAARIDTLVNRVSLTDIYWVRKEEEEITFEEVNLYDNHLDNAFIDVSLRGRQMTVRNDSLVPGPSPINSVISFKIFLSRYGRILFMNPKEETSNAGHTGAASCLL